MLMILITGLTAHLTGVVTGMERVAGLMTEASEMKSALYLVDSVLQQIDML